METKDMTPLHLRKSISWSPLRLGLLLLPLALAFFALSQTARAVSPAPDGGYPNGNTAEGDNALLSLTTGAYNTAIGFDALVFNKTGSYNTATGSLALFSNTGNFNTADGFEALFSNTTGYFNTASGFQALLSNTTGHDNTATGFYALYYNAANFNTATGSQALFHNTTGAFNTANGVYALLNNNTGHDNTATGTQALSNNTTGFDNTAMGSAAMASNADGNDNVAIGFRALQNHTTGNSNVAVGVNAMLSNTTGNSNVAIGVTAMQSAASGDNNIAIGTNAGGTGTASNTIHLGFGGQADDTNGRIRIGTPGTHTSAYITGILGVGVVASSAVPVYVDVNNQLGTVPSSRRFKKDIADMDDASEAILSMRPVTFHFKTQNAETPGPNIPQFGLIAEEVAEVNPDLVVRDVEGEVYTVRYEAVNAMLLNEFLKEHRTVQKLKSTVARQDAITAQQQKEIKALTASLKEQAAQIQKVSAQLEVSKPAPQTVLNDQ
jgi:hypothetical protein